MPDIPAVLDRREGREVTKFDPKQTRKKIGKADAMIQYAHNVQDWPLLEKAVDGKIEEIVEFVAWWNATVGFNKGGDRVSDQSPRSATLVPAAEEKTGIRKQQVSLER